jgi:uncharacterized protein (DUF433 family)
MKKMSHLDELPSETFWAFPEFRPSAGDLMVRQDWSLDALKPKAGSPLAEKWALHPTVSSKPSAHFALDWYVQCNLLGYSLLREVLEINPNRHGGVPVLRGTRFTAGQVLAELAESESVSTIAENYDLNPQHIEDMLNGLSLILMRPLHP